MEYSMVLSWEGHILIESIFGSCMVTRLHERLFVIFLLWLRYGGVRGGILVRDYSGQGAGGLQMGKLGCGGAFAVRRTTSACRKLTLNISLTYRSPEPDASQPLIGHLLSILFHFKA